MIQYECLNTGKVTEISQEQEAVFCTAMRYDLLYAMEYPRFSKNPIPIYGLPYHEKPEKSYFGFDRHGLCGFDEKKTVLSDGQRKLSEFVKEQDENGDQLMHTLDHAEFFCSIFAHEEQYEILWCRPEGSDEPAPNGFFSMGLDVGYTPCCEGGFSILCDTLFLCRWHGCDREGTLFRDDYERLNDYGLFSLVSDAKLFMEKYFAQPWTERGRVGIFEVFGR